MMRTLRFAALALLATTAIGCDASVAVQGKVYRWVDPPASARSQVLINESHLPSNVEPLAGAKITLYYSEDGAWKLDPKDQSWRDRETSGADGSFMTGGACAGGDYDMAVTVFHEGCQPLVQRFPYKQEHPEYEMAVVLVCPGIQESDRPRSPAS